MGLAGIEFEWSFSRAKGAARQAFDPSKFALPYRLHLGPGPNWRKPDAHWIDVDVAPDRGDIVVNFQDFAGFPLPAASADAIYGSHVFEHMSIWVTDAVFADSCRVLQPGGIMRMILPDAEKSIREYVAGNSGFELFRRRKERAREVFGLDYSLFDCLREDFLSRAQQTDLLGRNALAHQNAWDFDSLAGQLRRAGFAKVVRKGYQQSDSAHFAFEGTFPSEATEDYRSLYVEAHKA